MARPLPIVVVVTVFAASVAAASPIDLVRSLSSPAMAGRDSGAPGAAAAADTIAAHFAAAGLEPAGTDGWFQPVSLGGEAHAGRTCRNVVGRLVGAGPHADRWLIVGAHYDHLGVRLDDDGAPDGFYPGAEDNASGVAALCELARLAVDGEPPDRSILFVAFTGEEIGLQGSRRFVDDPPVSLDAVDLMMNLDSVGRLRDDRLYVGGVGSAEGLRDLIVDVNRSHRLELQISEGGWDASDHVSFNTAGVPVLFLFTGPHPQYHSVDDTWDLVEAEPLGRVVSFAESLIVRLGRRVEPFVYRAFTDLPDEDAAPVRGRKRAWLGTIPDFVDDVSGVKLAGVMPGSPAEEAGLVKGDVLIAFDGEEIASLEDLTVALQTHGEGEMVRIVFEREGERRTLPVTLRRRPR